MSAVWLRTGPGSSGSQKQCISDVQVSHRDKSGSYMQVTGRTFWTFASEPPAEPPQIFGSGLQQVLPILCSDPDVLSPELQNQNLGPDRQLPCERRATGSAETEPDGYTDRFWVRLMMKIPGLLSRIHLITPCAWKRRFIRASIAHQRRADGFQKTKPDGSDRTGSLVPLFPATPQQLRLSGLLQMHCGKNGRARASAGDAAVRWSLNPHALRVLHKTDLTQA